MLLSEAAPARAAAEQALLAQMSVALREVDYQGSFIYQHAGRIDALRIFHAGGGKERERLVSMSGARSEIVRDGTTVTCLQDGRPTVLLPDRAGAHLLPLVPDTRGLSFPKFYALQAGGYDRVAGYRARIIEIVPRDAFRYGYRIWLDDATHLPLRSAVVDGNGHGLEQFMFVALDIGAPPKESDLVPDHGSGVVAPPLEVRLGRPRWRVADPPPERLLCVSGRWVSFPAASSVVGHSRAGQAPSVSATMRAPRSGDMRALVVGSA